MHRITNVSNKAKCSCKVYFKCHNCKKCPLSYQATRQIRQVQCLKINSENHQALTQSKLGTRIMSDPWKYSCAQLLKKVDIQKPSSGLVPILSDSVHLTYSFHLLYNGFESIFYHFLIISYSVINIYPNFIKLLSI